MAYLNIENISVWYGRFRALKDVTLSIRKGELFTLLGPSGSGKSTILLSVAGFVRPQSGSISIGDEDITNLPPNKREIGMVFQSYSLFPHKSVFDNIAYPLQVRRRPKREIKKRVRELLKMIDLQGTEMRMPHELSGGQQQRVALARALIFNPRVLLLDEPLGSLDKKLREQMQLEIRHIHQASESTVLYVTHDQEEAMTISDRIAIIREGMIEQVGTPQQIYEEPANPFVADFLGGANFLKVRVLSLNQHTCVVECAGYQIEKVPKPEWLEQAGIWATLFVRPEHLRVIQDPPKGINELSCAVEESYYLGETQRLRCVLKDGSKVDIRQPAINKGGLNLGGNVYLHILPGKSRLFKETSGTWIHTRIDQERRKLNHV